MLHALPAYVFNHLPPSKSYIERQSHRIRCMPVTVCSLSPLPSDGRKMRSAAASTAPPTAKRSPHCSLISQTATRRARARMRLARSYLPPAPDHFTSPSCREPCSTNQPPSVPPWPADRGRGVPDDGCRPRSLSCPRGRVGQQGWRSRGAARSTAGGAGALPRFHRLGFYTRAFAAEHVCLWPRACVPHCSSHR